MAGARVSVQVEPPDPYAELVTKIRSVGARTSPERDQNLRALVLALAEQLRRPVANAPVLSNALRILDAYDVRYLISLGIADYEREKARLFVAWEPRNGPLPKGLPQRVRGMRGGVGP